MLNVRQRILVLTAGNTHVLWMRGVNSGGYSHTVSHIKLGLLLVLANSVEKLQVVMIIKITTTTENLGSLITYMTQFFPDCNASVGVH